MRDASMNSIQTAGARTSEGVGVLREHPGASTGSQRRHALGRSPLSDTRWSGYRTEPPQISGAPVQFVEPGYGPPVSDYAEYAQTAPALPAMPPMPAMPAVHPGQGMAAASVVPMPGLPTLPYSLPQVAPTLEPLVWLVATFTPGGGMHHMEGAGRPGAIRVSRPYGHLRAIRPVLPPGALGSGTDDALSASSPATSRTRRGRTARKGLGSAEAACAPQIPALRPLPQVISSIEVETDAAIFRVERPNDVLGHSDVAWALAHLEAGEPDSLVPLPRRQLALLLTLLPQPEDPERPEEDPTWGWAHRLRGPWERGPLHGRGRLGRLIAVDADPSGRGMHRACFELLGTEEVVWALGVPCFRPGSVYELIPLGRGSRWLTWPLSKSRSRSGTAEKPAWEIARVVYRVGSPRWPLAGVVEPLGPMGVAG
jgi:hypothetical protein